MVRSPSSLKETTVLKKGPWTSDEDEILTNHINIHGHPNWRALPRLAGLARCGKSCRLRWTNYLRPGIKRGNFTREEEEIIITSHQLLGNRWSAIAAKLPGRTDNEIKNVWHTHLKKKLLHKDDIQQLSASTNESSNSMMINDEKDFILVDESIFDRVWDPSNHIQHAYSDDPDHDQSDRVPNDTPARNGNNNHNVYVQSSLSLQRSYSETSYNNYKDDVPSPEEFPETDESFWSEVLSSDHDYNNSGSSSIENYYPCYDQNPVNESSFPPVSHDTVINMETDHPHDAHAFSLPNVVSNQVTNVSDGSTVEDGGDVEEFWFDVLFRGGEHPVFSQFDGMMMGQPCLTA